MSDRWAPLVGIIDTSTSYVDHRPLPAAVEVTSSGAEGGRLAHLCDQVERRAGAASGAHHAVSASQPLRPGTCIEPLEPFRILLLSFLGLDVGFQFLYKFDEFLLFFFMEFI